MKSSKRFPLARVFVMAGSFLLPTLASIAPAMAADEGTLPYDARFEGYKSRKVDLDVGVARITCCLADLGWLQSL